MINNQISILKIVYLGSQDLVALLQRTLPAGAELIPLAGELTREFVAGLQSLSPDLFIIASDYSRDSLARALMPFSSLKDLPMLWVTTDKDAGAEYFQLPDHLPILAQTLQSHLNAATRQQALSAEIEVMQKSRSLHQALIDLAADGILLGDTHGNIIGANDVMCQLAGRTKKELLSLHVRALFLPDELSKTPLRFDLLKKGENVISERQLLRADGTLLPIEMHTNMMPNGSYQSIYRDLSQRKAAEAALRESEEKFRQAFSTSPDSININRLSDGLYIEVNEGFIQTTGYTRDDVLGRSSTEINIWVDPADRAKLVEGLRHRGIVKDLQAKFRMKDGKIIDALMSASVIKLNNVPHILSITRDISMLIKAMDEIQKLNGELENRVAKRTEQLSTINEELEAFSYSISHDLRSPLRIINGFASILEEDYAPKLDREGRRICHTITQNVLKMGQLIDDILTFSHLSRTDLPLAPICVKNLLDPICRHHADPAHSRVRFDFGPLHDVRGDQATIRQVFANLISNAVKYSAHSEPPQIYITSWIDQDMVTYSIRDNGIGLEMQYAEKIFGVFQKLHSPADYEGNGIGLAIVASIVKKHGGRVWVESEVGKSATFYFTLPVCNNSL